MTESTELKAVLFAGEKLSNIAFNLRQRPGEPLSDTRETPDEQHP